MMYKQLLKFIFAMNILSAVASAQTADVDASVENLLQGARQRQLIKLSERMDYFSDQLLRRPYNFKDPLGEGSRGQFDRDPLYRLDEFDCTTFVETVISLARSQSLAEFKENMNQIRYKNGKPLFQERNHFTGLEWVPRNIQKNILTDVTRKVSGKYDVVFATAWIDKKNWYAKMTSSRIQGFADVDLITKVDQLRALGEKEKPTVEAVPYIPLENFLYDPGLLGKIPSGSVINIVRPNWNVKESIGTNMNISHQGLVIQLNGKTWLRHASKTMSATYEEELGPYLQRMMGNISIRGVEILQPLEVLP